MLEVHIAAIMQAIYNYKPLMSDILSDHNQMDLLNNLELPLARILADMEETGIYTDVNDLKEMQNELQEKLDNLVSEIYEAAGESFNINSPKQLGIVLFETLKLPIIKKQRRVILLRLMYLNSYKVNILLLITFLSIDSCQNYNQHM